MQRFVVVNEGVNVTYAAVVAKISLTRRRWLSVFRFLTVANNPLKTITYWHEKILRFGCDPRRSWRSISNHERLRDLAEGLLLRRFGLDFRGAHPETEQMSKSKLAAAEQICVA
jgi:hypothetical protein